MAKKDKLDEDFKNFNLDIERVAEQEKEKIREETKTLKEEAKKMGEAVELSINSREEVATQKKVNS